MELFDAIASVKRPERTLNPSLSPPPNPIDHPPPPPNALLSPSVYLPLNRKIYIDIYIYKSERETEIKEDAKDEDRWRGEPTPATN